MIWTLCIRETHDRTGRTYYDVFAYAECADGWPMSQDLGPFYDRDTALAFARYVAEEDPDYVLPLAEVVPFSRCRRRAA